MSRKWISIEERLPDDDELVEVIIVIKCKATHDSKREKGSWCIESLWEQMDVVGWRPLDGEV